MVQLRFVKGEGLPGPSVFQSMEGAPKFAPGVMPSRFWFYPLQGSQFYMGIPRSHQGRLEKAKTNEAKQRLLMGLAYKELEATRAGRPSPGMLVLVTKTKNTYRYESPVTHMGATKTAASMMELQRAASRIPVKKVPLSKVPDGAEAMFSPKAAVRSLRNQGVNDEEFLDSVKEYAKKEVPEAPSSGVTIREPKGGQSRASLAKNPDLPRTPQDHRARNIGARLHESFEAKTKPHELGVFFSHQSPRVLMDEKNMTLKATGDGSGALRRNYDSKRLASGETAAMEQMVRDRYGQRGVDYVRQHGYSKAMKKDLMRGHRKTAFGGFDHYHHFEVPRQVAEQNRFMREMQEQHRFAREMREQNRNGDPKGNRTPTAQDIRKLRKELKRAKSVVDSHLKSASSSEEEAWRLAYRAAEWATHAPHNRRDRNRATDAVVAMLLEKPKPLKPAPGIATVVGGGMGYLGGRALGSATSGVSSILRAATSQPKRARIYRAISEKAGPIGGAAGALIGSGILLAGEYSAKGRKNRQDREQEDLRDWEWRLQNQDKVRRIASRAVAEWTAPSEY